MPYCTATDVTKIIHTNLPPADIEDLIELADAEINSRELNLRSAGSKKIVSMFLTAVLCVASDPKSESMSGETSVYLSAEDWRQLAEAKIRSLTVGKPKGKCI